MQAQSPELKLPVQPKQKTKQKQASQKNNKNNTLKTVGLKCYPPALVTSKSY
jgi:hypothetical protein